MSKRGKSINVFLMDGEASGRIKCTLANWTGIAYKIPRNELDKCKEREDLKQSGIYFLFGASEETDDKFVYIGQAGARKNGEGILFRLLEHKRNPDKDYWTNAVVFTTTNNSFGPTEISYLENRFCTMALEAKRYVVKNGNDPNPGNTTEEKQSELEEYIDNAKILMGTLGFIVFEKLVQDATSTVNHQAQSDIVNSQMELFLRRKTRRSEKGVDAKCMRTNEGFAVLAGSQIEVNAAVSIPASVHEARKKIKISEDGSIEDDVLFSSPSAAAAFVLGSSANGLTEWKTTEGKTLGDIETSDG